jgi:hypothetical protein
VEAQLRRVRARRNEVRSTKGGEKVVERRFVGDVDGAHLQAPLVAVAVKQVVVPHGHVEEVAGRDSRRIMVIIFGSGALGS